MNLRNNKNNSYFLSSYNLSGTVVRCLLCIRVFSSPGCLASAITPSLPPLHRLVKLRLPDAGERAKATWLAGGRF